MLIARRAGVMVAALALAACGEGTAPEALPPAALRVAYTDAAGALQIVEEGRAPTATSIQGSRPFAQLPGGVIVEKFGALTRYQLDGSSITLPAALAGAQQAGGAMSPSGRQLAFSSRAAIGGAVHFHRIDITTGAHDSLEVSGRADYPAAGQIAGKLPAWSPSGDSVAFLLPNPITVQLFLYEVATGRIEMYALPVPVSTFAQPLHGWPHWSPDGSLQFVAHRWAKGAPTDTLVVMRVFPRERDRRAEVVFAAHTDSLPIDGGSSYSFSADGRGVALSLASKGRVGIFAMRRGSPRIEPLVYDAAAAPTQPLLIP